MLDGNVAYNVNAQGQAVRGGDVRDRRMWMHTNPVVAVRAALNGSATVSNRRQENGLTLVDLTLKEGDAHDDGDSAAVESRRPGFGGPARMPISARSSTPRISTATCRFDGVRLPMGYTTKLDWRDVDFLKLYVDGYLIDTVDRQTWRRRPRSHRARGARRRCGRWAGRRQRPGDARSRADCGGSPAARW